MNKPKQTIIYSYPDLRLDILTSGIQEEHQIVLQQDDWLLSPVFDSGHEGMNWDRLFLSILYESAQCFIWCYDIEVHLMNNQLSKESAVLVSNANHVLLKNVRGRYLRFAILNQGDQEVVFKGYECSFPYRTHLELLPQYYQSNEDLHVLFAPIEDVFLSLQAQIRTMHYMWDVRHGNEDQLKALLELLDLKEFGIFPIEVIREVLEYRHIWMKQRGTLPSLIKLAAILLQRNVMVELHSQDITMIVCFHHEEEAMIVTSILENEIPCGIALHMKWLVSATLDSAYVDLGLSLDQEEQTKIPQLNTGVYLWE